MSASPIAPVDVDAMAAVIVRAIDTQDAESLVALFSPPMREVLPVDKARPWTKHVIEQKGHLAKTTRLTGGSTTKATYRIDAEKGAWQLELHVGDGKVLGMKMTEPPAPEPAVVQNTIAIGLPFKDTWTVFWGGDRLEVNQHVLHKSQRRAADLVMTGPDGKTHVGDGKKNSDYLAYGREVLAVADGEVTTVIDGVPENEPGSMNPYFAMGNVVFVRHSDGLHSVYAHLQPGKIRVKPGAKIKRGAVLGLCGNSGNSSEPHLHFQLQDGPRFEASYGVEPLFHGVIVTRDGKSETRADYTFLKGDRTAPK